ncbi:hypothetical protein SEA_LEWANDO_49 [Arthrobacter phage Lewando]|nr:hypothetical protein SEA_LEWANDO_49 [Arthrobacter phage Lewando]
MIRKEITFEDLNGVTKTEAFWFNLNKRELLRLQFGVKGMDFQAVLQGMIDDKEGEFIMDAVDDVILKSIGQRTEDGRFVKDPEYINWFKSTEAFSELFTELCTDAENGAIFMNGLGPAGMQQSEAEVKARTAEEIRKASLAAKGGFVQKQVVTERPKVSLAEAQAMQNAGGVSAALR